MSSRCLSPGPIVPRVRKLKYGMLHHAPTSHRGRGTMGPGNKCRDDTCVCGAAPHTSLFGLAEPWVLGPSPRMTLRVRIVAFVAGGGGTTGGVRTNTALHNHDIVRMRSRA